MKERVESSIREDNVCYNLILSAIYEVKFFDGTCESCTLIVRSQYILAELELVFFRDIAIGEEVENKVGVDLKAAGLGALQVRQQAFYVYDLTLLKKCNC